MKMLKYVVCLFLSLLFFCCQNNDEFTSTSKNLTGKWKLVKVEEVFNNPTSYDYSPYNIVYEFQTKGVLTVSGETNNISMYRGHDIGEYSYSIVDEDQSYLLKIGNTTYWCQVTSEKLVIDSSPLDGPIYYFIKIK